MRKTALNKRKRIKSPLSLSTRKLKGYTLTSRRAKAIPKNVVQHPKLIEAKVTGVSMWPILRNDYSVFYKEITADQIEPGELIVFRGRDRKNRPLIKVHRYLGRVGPYLLEAGDNTFQGALLEEKDLLGKVHSVKDPKGKKVSLKGRAPIKARQKAFLHMAHGFMFIHEAKDRLIGGRKSLLLWKLSQFYRGGLKVMGLEVPPIYPR